MGKRKPEIDSSLLNKTFGRLTVEAVFKDTKGNKMCKCSCVCGNVTNVYYSNLVSGRTVSCGCRMKEMNSRYADIKGRQYNNLIVEEKTNKRKDETVVWKCRCILCGKYIEATKKQLDRGYVKDCGEHNSPYDLIGKKMGELSILSFNGKKYRCLCSCGSITYVERGNLISGHTKSCGHLQGEDNFERIEGAVPCLLMMKIPKSNTSGVKGVSKSKNNKWVSYITFKGKRYNLGTFDHKEDAIKARKNAEEELFLPIIEKYKSINVK